MKRARLLLVAGLLVLAIPTAVVVAAKPASTGLENAATHAGKTLPATGASDEVRDGETGDDQNEGQGQANRPHNHGWFVSQVAHDHSATGRAHGQAVSAAAHSSQGKPASAGGPDTAD